MRINKRVATALGIDLFSLFFFLFPFSFFFFFFPPGQFHGPMETDGLGAGVNRHHIPPSILYVPIRTSCTRKTRHFVPLSWKQTASFFTPPSYLSSFDSPVAKENRWHSPLIPKPVGRYAKPRKKEIVYLSTMVTRFVALIRFVICQVTPSNTIPPQPPPLPTPPPLYCCL